MAQEQNDKALEIANAAHKDEDRHLKVTLEGEPKFKVGDWTVSNLDGKARQISEVHFDEYNSYYVVNGKSVDIEEYDRLHHLFTIADAKDGDVLYDGNAACILRKTMEDDDAIWIDTYCGINIDNEFKVNDENECWCLSSDCSPATKEQRGLLFQKMREAGYEWDAEKKKIEQKSTEQNIDNRKLYDIVIEELSKYRGNEAYKAPWALDSTGVQYPLYFAELGAKWQKEQNLAWSEEDERNASYICAALDCYYRLREDRNNTNGQENLDKARNWLYNKLKSFKDKHTWKPSEE